ncbi:MAG: site-2 protease family protein [Pseudomonadota bacterium]
MNSVFNLPISTFLVLPISIIAFGVLLMIIVFIHEYGHFSMARMLGVRVDVFSIGFGKPILRWVDKKQTEWRISLLPLGGYVKFFGDLNAASQADPQINKEEAAEAHPVTTQFPRPGGKKDAARAMTPEERAVCFHFKPVWARSLIVAAGPVANFILAVFIFAGLFMMLGRPATDPVIGQVVPDSAAYEAGFEPGDRIVSANGRDVPTFQSLSDTIIVSGGREIEFVVQRGDALLTLRAAPLRVVSEDRYGNEIERWLLGVSPDPNAVSFKKFGPFAALGEGVSELARVLSITVQYLGRIIAGQENADQLGGPIKMTQYAGQSVMSGFDGSSYAEPPSFVTMLKGSLVDFIHLAAVVSVSIGFLNLLPVPVLDGGHLVYYAYEAVAGKPLGPKAQAFGFRIGVVLLASLMLFVTWNDINNLLSSLS